MANFTVRVELKGSHIDGFEYTDLHTLMREMKFFLSIYPPMQFGALRARVAPLPKLVDMPHATYFGDSNRTTSDLLNTLRDMIQKRIQTDIVIFVAETASYDIYPKP